MQDAFRRDGLTGFAPSEQLVRDSALLRATTELFVQEPTHDGDESRRFEELAISLFPRVSIEDRMFLADRLATRLDAPATLMRMLARDGVAVAAAVIRKSPVLASIDLLAVIAATGPEHHRLIAERPGLSADVIKALRVAGDKHAISTLDESDARPQPSRFQSGASARGSAGHPAETTGATKSGTAPPHRFDPWRFLALERPARLQEMADLAMRPPSRRYSGPTERLDRAFRSMLSAAQVVAFARSGQREKLIEAIAEGTQLERDFVAACLDDATGEGLAILLKAIALDNVQAQQVFLLAGSKIGRDVDAFFRLCDLYTTTEPIVAETLVVAWSGERTTRTGHHQPLFLPSGDRQRSGASEATRDRQPPSSERLRQS